MHGVLGVAPLAPLLNFDMSLMLILLSELFPESTSIIGFSYLLLLGRHRPPFHMSPCCVRGAFSLSVLSQDYKASGAE